MRFQSYFNTAIALIEKYDGKRPLVHYLKEYFSQHKKHGSKDRKHIAHLCYCYYRLGHALKNRDSEYRLRMALFLCQDEPGEWLPLFEEKWIENWHPSLQRRIDFMHEQHPLFRIETVFPWIAELSDGIDGDAFTRSQFIQPDLFVRIRPGKEKKITDKLLQSGIPFRLLPGNCVVMPNGSKIDELAETDSEIVIQDYSSQRIASLLELTIQPLGAPQKLWDCCAASGGKSILAKDLFGNIQITVSDTRSSILHNLKRRFEKAGIHHYDAFIANLSLPLNANPQTTNYNLILCDTPCSGSGTWSRTPEQLCYFKTEKIEQYAALQKKIAGNVLPYLATGGWMLYITCSVFRKENEAVVTDILQQNKSLELVKMELLKGYALRADSMFAALFRKK